ncbi:MAG TPA: glycosyltransferase [Solirubrobacteraceae bacterium]|nr:glycosyltransferase [Solirubrobacteraceae bacterium]
MANSPRRLRVAILTARVPAADGTGDQLRAHQFATALSARHDVTVLTTGAGHATRQASPAARIVQVPCGRLDRVRGALGALLRGQPMQVGWMTPGRAWRELVRHAAGFDVALVVTVRSLRGPLSVPFAIDHVDALSLNMRRRSRGQEPWPLRLVLRCEAPLLARYERRIVRRAAAQLVISDSDAAALPAAPPPVVLPNAVAVAERVADQERDIDVMFTGNMRYPPNVDAARWLTREIAPAIRRRRPQTSFAIVGRSADLLDVPDWMEVHSDVPSLADYLVRARTAVVPLRLGTGAPNKVLEAIAAGAVVVGTSDALAPFSLPPGVAAEADTTDALADAVLGLLSDPAGLEARREAGSEQLVRFTPAALRTALERIIDEVESSAPAHPSSEGA